MKGADGGAAQRGVLEYLVFGSQRVNRTMSM